MSDPIAVQLRRLRDSYASWLARLDASDMDALFRRVSMKQTQQGIDECERQIEEEERLHCDIYEAKAHQDAQEP